MNNIESKKVFVVQGKEFTSKDSAEYYIKLSEARKAYHSAAKEYEQTLNDCTCEEKMLIEKVQRDYGKPYQDEFDNWHNDRIEVENYRCSCCGKGWSYADFNGEGLRWKHDGKILVKRGVF